MDPVPRRILGKSGVQCDTIEGSMEENVSQTDTGGMEEDSEGTLTAFKKVRLTKLKFSYTVSTETIIAIFTCRVKVFSNEVFRNEIINDQITHTANSRT